MPAHIEPDDEGLNAVKELPDGPVHMLNLLRFKAVADFSRWPDLAGEPDETGMQAYERYAQASLPFVEKVGGEVVFFGQSIGTVIGPPGEWDLTVLMKYPSRDAFLEMIFDPDYLAITGLRSASLSDSRLVALRAAI